MTIRSRDRKRQQRLHAECVRLGLGLWTYQSTADQVAPHDSRNHDDRPQKDHAWLIENAKRNQPAR